MVLLTITPSIVEALRKFQQPQESRETIETDEEESPAQNTDEPSLENPEVGKPISHGQIIDLWNQLKASGDSACSLERLLRGANVYMPPPPPKSEPTPQYKALMARLRRDEEARSYSRMLNPPRETFSSRFPSSVSAFEAVNRPQKDTDIDDDDITLTEVHRQVTLILNFLVSIAGVAATLWVVSRWWSVPARLFLTMGGSILVAIAEVAVYSGYLWRLGEAKKKQAGVLELKEVVETWVVGMDGDDKDGDEEDGERETVLLKEKKEDLSEGVRKRRTELKEET
ncbi:Fc.00g027120.m01.CDS01 [Cosmosporella sp. VM-42]